jgi:hypothetical protein
MSQKQPGKTREKLVTMICQLTGVLVMAEDIWQANPRVRYYQDGCAWDCWGVMPAKDGLPSHRVHLYSFDTMGMCVKNGICRVTEDYKSTGGISPSDFEISSK